MGQHRTTHGAHAGWKHRLALQGGHGEDFRGKVESTRMGMKLWSFAHKSDNRKDTRLVHTNLLKSFIHFLQDFNQRSYTKQFRLGKSQRLMKTRGEKGETK